jgi:predicted aspartyl protease
MRLSAWLSGVAAALVITTPAAAQQQCKLNKVGELPVRMDGNRPFIEGAVNGKPILALADTGASTSILRRGAVSRLGLTLANLRGVTVWGIGGESSAYSTRISELKLGSYAVRDFDILVAGSQEARGEGEDSLLIGWDFFLNFDVEFDLKNNVIRFFKPVDCKDVPLEYWGQTYSLAEIKRNNTRNLLVDVQVNGKTVTAEMDSGAFTSIISTRAAARAGVTPQSPGVTSSGVIGGLGAGAVESWIGVFDTFSFGDETVRRAKLRLADLFQHNTYRETGALTSRRVATQTEMFLGADFFRAHRLLISNSQGKIYFTHNGGPVFQTVGPAFDPTTNRQVQLPDADDSRRR